MFRSANLISLFSLNAALLVALPAAVWAASGDTIPGHPDVLGEYVQIEGIAAAGTPGVLNTASYLRVRLAADGESPKPANAIVIAQPGFSSTPGIWTELSAQLVEKAAARNCAEHGKPSPCRIEVWIMDRRGSQMEDTAGLRIARSTTTSGTWSSASAFPASGASPSFPIPTRCSRFPSWGGPSSR